MKTLTPTLIVLLVLQMIVGSVHGQAPLQKTEKKQRNLAGSAGEDPELLGKQWIGLVQLKPQRKYLLSMKNFGIEQWEGSKKGHRTQRWSLHCSHPSTAQQGTSCTLDRLVIDRWQGIKGAVVAIHQHSTAEGTLKILTANWSQGKLDFEILHIDGSKASVYLDMEYSDLGKDALSIRLTSFKGIGSGRGLVSGQPFNLEYRIQEYSSVYTIPIEMKGIKTEGQKFWDELLDSLDKTDQEIWRRGRTHLGVVMRSTFEKATTDVNLENLIPERQKMLQNVRRKGDTPALIIAGPSA